MSTSLCSAVTYGTGLRRVQRGYILYHFLFFPSGVVLTLFMIRLRASQYPPASWCFNANFCRSLMLHLSVCVSFSELYLFSSVFSLHFSHRTLTVSSWQQQGHVAGCLGLLFLPLLSRRRARCRLYTHFLTTRSRGSVFCCSWIALSKSLSFTLSVCAARLTKTQTAFFQPEVLVLAIVASPWPPYYLRTHTLISNPLSETPNISFWRQG